MPATYAKPLAKPGRTLLDSPRPLAARRLSVDLLVAPQASGEDMEPAVLSTATRYQRGSIRESLTLAMLSMHFLESSGDIIRY